MKKTKHGKKLLAILALVLALTLVFCSCGGKKDAKAEDETKITGTAETGDTPADTDEPDEIEIDGDYVLDLGDADVSAFSDIMFAGMGDGEIAAMLKENMDKDVMENGLKKFFKEFTFSFDAENGAVKVSVDAEAIGNVMVDLVADILRSVPMNAFAEASGVSVEDVELGLKQMNMTWDEFVGQLVDGMRDSLKESMMESFEDFCENETTFTVEDNKLTIGEGTDAVTLTLKKNSNGFSIVDVDASATNDDAVKMLFPEGAALKKK